MKRFWEIDFFRGIAIIMMVLYHLLFNLAVYGAFNINIQTGFWMYFARLTAFIFIFLVGVSLTIKYNKGNKQFKPFFVRGIKIFGFGLLITLVTWIFLKEGFVIFGVLHLIGLSVIIGYPFIRLKYTNIFLGLIFIGIGLYLYTVSFSFPWLYWLGFRFPGFYSVDYFALFPWFGVVLLGIFFGNKMYLGNKRNFKLIDLNDNAVINFFSWLGRKSLIIYLVHQPIIIGILLSLGLISIA